MQIGPLNIAGDLVLAPMAGVTDWAFRSVCAELGAAVTVTEMVSSRALVYHDKKSLRLLRKTPAGLCGAQLFGNDPAVMAEAAALAAYFSQAQNSTKVPVDFTQVKYVKKPAGARPGMVIYTTYQTMLADPDEKLVHTLAVR